MTADDTVWYAGYASNLSWSRLRCYLEGGRAPGARHPNRGARDPSPPLEHRTATIPHRIRFARESRVWRGGIAFLESDADGEPTLVRLWRITREQLHDVHAQENGRGWYPDLVDVGVVDDTEVWSVTDERIRHVEPTRPTAAYLRSMATGLREAAGYDTTKVADYLLGLCHMTTWFTRRELVGALEAAPVDQPLRSSRQSARYDGYSSAGTT